MFKANSKNTRKMPLATGVVLISLFLTLNIFHTLLYVSIVNFEHVFAPPPFRSLTLQNLKYSFNLKYAIHFIELRIMIDWIYHKPAHWVWS